MISLFKSINYFLFRFRLVIRCSIYCIVRKSFSILVNNFFFMNSFFFKKKLIKTFLGVVVVIGRQLTDALLCLHEKHHVNNQFFILWLCVFFHSLSASWYIEIWIRSMSTATIFAKVSFNYIFFWKMLTTMIGFIDLVKIGGFRAARAVRMRQQQQQMQLE